MRTVYLDLDGVITNWNKAALKLIGMDDEEPQLKEMLRDADYGLENVIPGFREAMEKVDRSGPEFWQNLQLMPWARDLISYLKGKCPGVHPRERHLVFVTSPGRWTGAGTGKMVWHQEYFPDVPLCICKEKYLLAASNKLLVDDKPSAITEFDEAGGKTFLWPNQYALMSGKINLFETIGALELKLREI